MTTIKPYGKEVYINGQTITDVQPEILVLKWDGSELGDISNYITHTYETSTQIYYYIMGSFIITTPTYHIVTLKEYKNNIPLISDELKPLFNLPKVGRHSVTLNDKRYIMSRYYGHEFRLEPQYIKVFPQLGNSIKLCYTFRWILGLTLSTDSSMIIRQYPNALITAISYKERNLDYTDLKRGSKLSQKCLRQWFNDSNEEINKTVKLMINDRDLTLLRFDIDRIVRRVDKNMVWWTAFILERLSWQMTLTSMSSTTSLKVDGVVTTVLDIK
jgi:hypothetical protein